MILQSEMARTMLAGASDAFLKGSPSRAEIYDLIGSIADALKLATGRIEAVESRGVKYCGTFQRALDYRKGGIVTHDGAMWTALRDVEPGEVPGKVPDAWQLSEKLWRENGR